MAANTVRPAGWSGELQDLQDETLRLLHTIRDGSVPLQHHQQQQQQEGQQSGRHASRRSRKVRTKGGATAIVGRGDAQLTANGGYNKGNDTSRRRRRRRRVGRKAPDTSQRHSSPTGHEAPGPRRFSYTLDTSGWPGGGDVSRSSGVPISEMGMGKTTVEILDKGEDTPRSPPISKRPPGDGAPPPEFHGVSKGADLTPGIQEDEGRFRSLTFKDEEGRVRDGFDTYVPDHTRGLGEKLQRLRAERDRLAGIEEAQRKICRGAKRQEFLRFARRKWLASDLAAETLQRVFRGHIGRRRAALSAEVLRLTGDARTEWVEVRDHNRGEAWYFNPLTGKSQWERPASLLGTMTPSEKVRTLPTLGPSSPSKKRPLPKCLDPGALVERGNHVGSNYPGGVEKGRLASPQQQPRQAVAGAPSFPSSPTKPSSPGRTWSKRGQFVDGFIASASSATLPPLMKGSRLSVLSTTPAVPESRNGGLATSSGPGGHVEVEEGGRGDGGGGGRWRDKQQAWVERRQEQGEGGIDVFPFLVEDEMLLPDDGFEETGLGSAGRGKEGDADEGSSDEATDDDDDDGARGSSSFFLADGTPNIRLRRTIAKALRVTKFDSVSTLLADYTGRKLAATTERDAAGSAAESSSSHPKGRRRAATAAPTSGDGTRLRTSKKRSRPNSDNASGKTGENAEVNKVARGSTATGTRVNDREIIPQCYPSGKLEEDKTPPLFASSAEGGRKMVSLMGAAGAKSAGGGAGHGGGTRRRARTAGVASRGQHAGEKGSALKGLAIRDITPPGFVVAHAGARATVEATKTGGNSPQGTAAAAAGVATAKGGGGGTDSAVSRAVQGDGTPGDTEATAAAAGGGTVPVSGDSTDQDQAKKGGPDAQKAKEICFNCWSKGSGKTCGLHTSQAGTRGSGDGGNGGRSGSTSGKKADGEARVAESALMCKNWDVGVMRRRYRSEELQEIFAKEASSLRYDKERKKFISTVEQRHPIYRLLAKIVARYNFTVRRRLHQKNWMRGFVEQLRMGKVVGIVADEARRTAKLLKLRNTLQNLAQVSAFTATAKATQPQAPITGTTLAERRGLVKVVVDRPSTAMGRVTRVVLDGPTPVPQVLYEARRYTLPAAKTMPMPEPRYFEDIAEGNESEATADTVGRQDAQADRRGEGAPSSATHSLAAWMPLLCKTTADGILHSAVTNVEVMSPVPGSDEVGRTKHPPALTIKFATFSRKHTPAMMAVGGLPAEMVVHMLVSTRMSPQYGNFTVMQKSSVAPTVSKERSAEYESLELLVENQAFLPRALQHPLNSRKAPTVAVKTLMADPGNRHYFGLNRPEQTGEADSHGFRTSAHADAAPALPTLDPTAFMPSEEVVTPNLCSANRTVTTHADRSYPFCEPSNRSNTTLDFYHLLLTATCSPNKEQVFTNLGAQECGEFMRGSDPMRPMGHCIGIVYRSWAFLQRQVLEEFETDDGVSYWFDRRTGETFWERPLCPEEKVPIKEGGTILGGQGEPPDSSSGAFESIKPRYDQQQMRKLMMKSYEGTEALERRRKQVSTGVKWARESGALPPPDPSDLRPPTPDADDDDVRGPEEYNATLGGRRTSSSGYENSGTPLTSTSTGTPSSDNNADQHQEKTGDNSPRRSPTGGGVGSHRSEGVGRRTGRGGGGGGSETKGDRLAASISQALKDAGLNEGRNVKPSDMLRFGMGLGITLGANGLLGDLGGGSGDAGGGGVRGRGGERREIEATGEVEASLAPPVVKISPNGHPIGHGHTEPIAEKEDSVILDHKSEAEHLASIVRDSAGLKTSEEFKGLLVVPPEPTPCPDDDYGVTRPEDAEADPRRKAELSIPIIAYPETLWKKQYRGHGAAGEGQSWQPAGGDRAANQRAKSSLGVTMRRTNETLPEGFLNAISHTHVGKQHCDYLPHVPNMPQARAIGRVKPRSAADDWFAVGFDPWSAGREPLSAEFIPTLSIKQEDLGGDDNGGGSSTVPQTGYLELKDSAGHAEMAVVSAEEAKLANDFEQITSWARHARYADVETAMNQADWTMPIDYQNDLGLTLLHVAAQNGNKRIAKLCLRKGADVNKRNNNGQTALHYAYSYGFESFGEYLISKGADDSIVNADGLTCYEGLNQDNLGQL